MEETKYDTIKASKSKKNLYFAVFIANVGTLARGCALGWSSPSLARLTSSDSPLPVTKGEAAWLASLLPLGMLMFGPFVTSRLLDGIGRRRTLLVSQLLLVVSWAVLFCRHSVWLLFLARLITGIAEGIAMAATPVYVAEISESSVRATLQSMMALCLRVPLMLSFAVGPVVSYHTFVLISSVPVFVFLALYHWMPESPHFSVMRGREDEAMKSLEWLRQSDCDPDQLAQEIVAIKRSVAEQREGSWAELFQHRRALLILSSLQSFQQFSGGTVLVFYTHTVLQLAGVRVRAGLCGVLVAAVMVAGSLLPPPLVSAFGYRAPLLASCLASATGMGVFAYSVQVGASGTGSGVDGALDSSASTTLQLVIVLALAAFIIVDMAGLNSLPWALTGEYFPGSVRAKGSAVVTCVFSMEAFLTSNLFIHVVQLIGFPFTCWCWFGVLVLASIVVFLFVPETSGLSLDEIQQVLNKKKTPDIEKVEVNSLLK